MPSGWMTAAPIFAWLRSGPRPPLRAGDILLLRPSLPVNAAHYKLPCLARASVTDVANSLKLREQDLTQPGKDGSERVTNPVEIESYPYYTTTFQFVKYHF